MNRMELGRWIMTGILLMQSLLGFALDWSGNHLLNPLWHPHARFAIVVAALISLSFWTPFFYITFLLPSATLWAGDPSRVPHLGSSVFYPNVAVAGLFLALTAAAWLKE